MNTMVPLSPIESTETSPGGQYRANAASSTNPQQAPLRRAHYVKVVDLATLNKLDIEKIKLETAKKKEELNLKTVATSKGDDSNASRDDESSTIPKYQKRVVPSTGGFNLCLLVGDINIVVEKTRVDKSQVRLAECEVGDETGTLSLRARDDQINILQEIANRNGAVVLRNCSLELYQGKFIRLAVSKWGKIHSFPDGVSSTPTPPSTMNDSLHLSIVDLNEVAGDDWNESLLTPNSTDRNAQRDSPGSGATDNFTGRDKHNRHSPRQRPSRHGSGGHGHQSYSKDKRHNRNKKTSSGGGGYNTNIVHMVPGMPSLPLYAAPHYNYARFDQHAMQNMYHQHPNQHQQQQQQVHQEDYSYMSYQEYTMRMQMEAMRLSYQQQAPQHQHQHRAGRHIYHPISPQGSQAHNHNPNAFTDSHGHQTQFPVPSHQSAPSNDFSQTSQSPVAAMATAPIAPSPVSGAASSPYTATMAHAEAWSIQQEAESPMMNPHAAVFNSAHANMPSLTLPDNHYYAQNASYSLTPYMQVGQSQGQVPGHSMTSAEAYPTPGAQEPALADGSEETQ